MHCTIIRGVFRLCFMVVMHRASSDAPVSLHPVYQPAYGRHPSFGSEGDGSFFYSARSFIYVQTKVDSESLLAHACESMKSASVMLIDFAALVGEPYRSTMLGIQQVVMNGELAVNRVLDNLDPQG
ncbi:DUF6124 family protein [Pseudomonas lini]